VPRLVGDELEQDKPQLARIEETPAAVGLSPVFHPAPAEAAAVTMVTMAKLSVLARTKPALVMAFVKSHSQVSSFVDDMIRYILVYRNVKP
jgi:hypothetical protein